MYRLLQDLSIKGSDALHRQVWGSSELDSDHFLVIGLKHVIKQSKRSRSVIKDYLLLEFEHDRRATPSLPRPGHLVVCLDPTGRFDDLSAPLLLFLNADIDALHRTG